ncbi:MAG: CRISPR-associated endoribonuclease Cas6 [Bacteroidales bacterium]|nr:CRISPR-associated endoribonuclease Cas6 [Bacteroidales bacterium]
MRFKITLRPIGQGQQVLPINYQHPLASWIYKTIAGGNAQYAQWLHENGFKERDKRFKMFCFSNLSTPNARVEGDRLYLSGADSTFVLSFLPQRSTEEFVKGLFSQQEFELGDRNSRARLNVNTIEMVQEPEFGTEMEFECMSPLTVSAFRTDQSKEYLAPHDPRYANAIIENLATKHTAYYGTAPERITDEKFELLGQPKMKGVFINKSGLNKPIKVIGYKYRFRLKASAQLLRIGYQTGFGELNSMGFGCVGEKEKKKAG